MTNVTPQPPKNLSLHKMIPNMITLTALAAGMTSVKFAIAERWEAAVIAIVVAAFMDAFDGAAARLLKAQSKLGAELDSFSDFLCFGVAPALLVFLWTLDDMPRWGWPVALVYVMAVALRLARFNVQNEEKPIAAPTKNPLDLYFTGVPSPAGAGLLLLPLIVSFQVEAADADIINHPKIIALWMLVVAGMMVSNIPTFSSKQIRIPYKMRIPFLAIFAIVLAGLINETWPTLTLLGATYLFMMPLGVRHHAQKEKALATGVPDPEDIDIED